MNSTCGALLCAFDTAFAFAIGEKQSAQRIRFRKLVLERLDHAGRGNRSGDERDADRLEFLRRHCLRGITGPEAVAVAGDGREAGDARVRDRVVDFRALDIRGAMVAATEARVARARPARRRVAREIRRQPGFETFTSWPAVSRSAPRTTSRSPALSAPRTSTLSPVAAAADTGICSAVFCAETRMT